MPPANRPRAASAAPTRRALAATALVVFVAAGVPAAAELSRRDRREAGRMLARGDLYLRVDAPCVKGVHPFGVFLSPLVEVSPRGASDDFTSLAAVGRHHAVGTFWAARVNDQMRLDDLEWDAEAGIVELELEGVGRSAGRDTVLRFVGIHSLGDFEDAFGHAFATRPLEEEHPEWPAEVRTAIGQRRLLHGMTRYQAYVAVGAPAEVERWESDGVAVELWELQPDGLDVRGLGLGSGRAVRFEDGRLVAAPPAGDEAVAVDRH